MRRLTLEFSVNDVGTELPIHKIKSLEILHILRLEPSEFSALVRINFGNEQIKFEDLFPGSATAKIEAEFLEEDKEGKTYFMKITPKPGRRRPQFLSQFTSGAYLSPPFEFKDGKLKVAYVGTAKQMNDILKALEESKVKYKIVSMMDARFSPTSPLQRLTEKQREILIKAFKLGYYDRPRKITSEQLAQTTNLAKSTLVAHRRKAERRLLAEVLGGS